MSFNIEQVDVTICGGGPVGLLTAHGLLRAGVSSCVIERDIKADMPEYGRACSIFPRSLELLDWLDLLHDLAQVGFIDRAAFSQKGIDDVFLSDSNLRKSQMAGTYLDFVLNLRSKRTESIFQQAYESGGGIVAMGWQLTDIAIDPAQMPYQVIIQMKNLTNGDFKIIKSKYLIGADGLRSTVRTFSGIYTPWSNVIFNWVRVDGVIETDFLEAQLGSATIESPTHGVVQICRLDHGRSRIGFGFSLDMSRKYGQYMTQEQAIHESQQAMLPWKYVFKEIDWYTCYSVHDGVADIFTRGPVILVGDAAHVHSSGLSQGLNAGIHDAVNLAWKLAGVVKGQFDTAVLDTYDIERRPVARHMIDLDRQISAAVPFTPVDEYGVPRMDLSAAVKKLSQEATQLNVGLEIHYPENVINSRSGIALPGGCRAPDGLLYSPGSRIPTRMQQIIRNNGQFNILLFVGEPLQTKESILSLRAYLDQSSRSITKQYPGACRLLTVLSGNRSQGEVNLGCHRFGNLWYDHGSTLHYAYGVAPDVGAIVIVRPDGIVGYSTALARGEDLADYFGNFMRLGLTQ